MAIVMSTNSRAEYINTVVGQVKFPFDRKGIAKELDDHIDELECFYLDIRLDEEEAARRAVNEMGDPLEIGKALNQVHKPMLGWLWIVSKYLCITLSVLSIILVSARIYGSWGKAREIAPPTFDGKAVFEIIGIEYSNINIIYDGLVNQRLKMKNETLIFERMMQNSDGTIILFYQSIMNFDPFGIDIGAFPIQKMSILSSPNNLEVQFSQEQADIRTYRGHKLLVARNLSSDVQKIDLVVMSHTGNSRFTIKGD